MYSLMSILIKESSESNNSLANTLANWVLPTPVCPRKIKEPIGLLGSFNPTLFLWMAFTTLATAWSWPTTFPFIIWGSSPSLWLSASATLFTGIPVIIETTSATLSSVTTSLFNLESSSHCCWAECNAASMFFSSSRSFAASSYFWPLTAFVLLLLIFSSCFSNSRTCSGTTILVIWILEPASSKASMALSGKYLSVIYLFVNLTQASIASSV